jgi:hypothetical protein
VDVTQIVVVGLIVLAVVAFIVWPMLGRKRAPTAAAPVVDVDRIESRINDYRAALRRKAVCDSCLFANAEGARFCAECGTRLPGAGPAVV